MEPGVDGIAVLISFVFVLFFSFFFKPFSGNFDFKDFNVRHLALRCAVFHPYG